MADAVGERETESELWQIHNEIKAIYEGAGYPVYEVSALTGMGLDRIKQLIEGKVTLFSGHSGVGKSALLNAIDPSLNLRVGEVSEWSLKGKHTTTFAEIFPIKLTGNGERETENGERLTLALDGLQDPGNMGTIMRIADWYGIRHIVCSRDTVSCYNPKVVQATMGAIFRTRIDYCDLAEWLDEAANKGYATYAAMLDGEPYQTATLEQPAALVIGNEGKGISPNVAANVQHKLTIPNIGGTCESLNAAVATALLCAEFYR